MLGRASLGIPSLGPALTLAVRKAALRPSESWTCVGVAVVGDSDGAAVGATGGTRVVGANDGSFFGASVGATVGNNGVGSSVCTGVGATTPGGEKMLLTSSSMCANPS